MDYKKEKRYPRYTSYPIYPFWNNKLKEVEIKEELGSLSTEIDLYIHIPFCKKPCFYCGCNKIIARQDGSKEGEYVDYLLKEWELYKETIPNIKVRSIHFGGGTPTFLSADLIEKLLVSILGGRTCDISIEIDPRITTEDQIKVFKKFGAIKFSMGIQDFSADVQKVINREQPAELVDELVTKVRKYHIEEVNFDLIYGLPAQTNKTIDDTLESVTKINPDTISLFSYAHLPGAFPLQKRMEKSMNLTTEDKDKMYHYYKEQLQLSGYEQMGLDHFAKKESLLYAAYKDHKVGRNFMGYTTQKTSAVLGIGVSSISSVGGIFYQNYKELKKYYKALDDKILPVFFSHEKSLDDHMVSKMIEEMMCYKEADIREYLSLYKMQDLEGFFKMLNAEFVNPGVCTYEDGILTLIDGQELFLRKLCHFLDPYFPLGLS